MRLFQSIYKIKIVFIKILKCYLRFPHSFTYDCTVEFARGYKTCDDTIAMTTDGMCTCVLLVLMFFSLIYNMVKFKNKRSLRSFVLFKTTTSFGNCCPRVFQSLCTETHIQNFTRALSVAHDDSWAGVGVSAPHVDTAVGWPPHVSGQWYKASSDTIQGEVGVSSILSPPVGGGHLSSLSGLQVMPQSWLPTWPAQPSLTPAQLGC